MISQQLEKSLKPYMTTYKERWWLSQYRKILEAMSALEDGEVQRLVDYISLLTEVGSRLPMQRISESLMPTQTVRLEGSESGMDAK